MFVCCLLFVANSAERKEETTRGGGEGTALIVKYVYTTVETTTEGRDLWVGLYQKHSSSVCLSTSRVDTVTFHVPTGIPFNPFPTDCC